MEYKITKGDIRIVMTEDIDLLYWEEYKQELVWNIKEHIPLFP